jgi:hypothetical protein
MLKLLKILLRPYALTWVVMYFPAMTMMSVVKQVLYASWRDMGPLEYTISLIIPYMICNLFISFMAEVALLARFLKFYAIPFYTLQVLFFMAIIFRLCWDGGNLADISGHVWFEAYQLWVYFSLAAFFLSSIIAFIWCVARHLWERRRNKSGAEPTG